MGKANTGSFKKGGVGNPRGRPKGSCSPLRRQLMQLRNKAAEKVDEAFQVLWNDFNNDEEPSKQALAKQIYFKELVSIPKEWLSETDTSDIPKEIKSIDDIDSTLAALASKLLNVDSISTDEVHSLIKTLNNIKFTERFGKPKMDDDLMTLEERNARDKEVREFLEWRKLKRNGEA
jgi:hypothetical protein